VGEMLKLRTEFPNRAVAIVSHGDPIRAALNYFFGSPLDLFHRIEISIGSISVVTLSEREVRILRLNEVPRLKHEV
jgi:broad specificity phosphatase PhoE